MSDRKRIAIIIAVSFITIGLLVFITGFVLSGFSFKKAFDKNIVENTYEVSSPFASISIDGTVQDIEFIKATDGVNKVVVKEHKDIKFSVEVVNDVLTVCYDDDRNFVAKYLSSNGFAKKYIKVYLTENSYNSLKINVATGDVQIPQDYAFTSVEVSSSTGDVEFSATVSSELKIMVSTGDVKIKNSALGSLVIDGSTSDIEIYNVTVSGAVDIKISTGDVDCEGFLSANSVSVETSTGDVDLKIKGLKEEYSYSYDVSTGNSNLDAFTNQNGKIIFVKTSTGDININFVQ